MKNKKQIISSIIGTLIVVFIVWGSVNYFKPELIEPESEIVLETTPRIYDSCIEIDGEISCSRCIDGYCKPIEKFYPELSKPKDVPVGLTDWETITQYQYGNIIFPLYKLESDGGTSDGCKNVAQGMVNGFGYRHDMGDTDWRCFNDLEEVAGVVNNWFSDRFEEGLNQKQAICLYGTGRISTNCDYWKAYKSIGAASYTSDMIKTMMDLEVDSDGKIVHISSQKKG